MIHKLYSSLALAIVLSQMYYGNVEKGMLTSLLLAVGLLGLAVAGDWIIMHLRKKKPGNSN